MVKIKRVRTIDAVVMGWRPGQGRAHGRRADPRALHARRAPARGRALQRLHGQGEARARRLPGAVRDRRARQRRGQPLDPGARARVGRAAARAGRRDHLRPRLRRAHPPRREGPALARGQGPGGLHGGPARPVESGSESGRARRGVRPVPRRSQRADRGARRRRADRRLPRRLRQPGARAHQRDADRRHRRPPAAGLRPRLPRRRARSRPTARWSRPARRGSRRWPSTASWAAAIWPASSRCGR